MSYFLKRKFIFQVKTQMLKFNEGDPFKIYFKKARGIQYSFRADNAERPERDVPAEWRLWSGDSNRHTHDEDLHRVTNMGTTSL